MRVADRMTFSKAGALALVALMLAPVAHADQASVNRARVEHASIALPGNSARECWARYSAAAAQPRNGVIEEVAFRVPCREQMGQGFVETLQRALMARGFHQGPVTGKADAQTRAAVQAFQKANGFNSPILTLDTAQRLGLVPIEVSRN